MSQLKNDFSTFQKEWINKPSKITKNEESELPEDLKLVYIRYKHLLLNNLFFKKIWKSNKAQPTWKNNWKKDFLEKCNTNWLSKEIISYPLEDIFSYLSDNINELKNINIKQIDVAKNFWIKNLGTFYRIVKALWFLKKLNWKLINLSVEKFEKLNIEINSFLIKNNDIIWKDILEIWKKLDINNPEFIYSAISALWIAEKYWIKKLKISKIDLVEEIIEYIKENYKNNHSFDRNDVLIILNEYYKELWNNEKNNITKITSLLRFYWYKVEDIREYR